MGSLITEKLLVIVESKIDNKRFTVKNRIGMAMIVKIDGSACFRATLRGLAVPFSFLFVACLIKIAANKKIKRPTAKIATVMKKTGKSLKLIPSFKSLNDFLNIRKLIKSKDINFVNRYRPSSITHQALTNILQKIVKTPY